MATYEYKDGSKQLNDNGTVEYVGETPLTEGQIKQGCRPHLHYLSDSFGISKEDLIEMEKMGKYPNTPVHIPLIMDAES